MCSKGKKIEFTKMHGAGNDYIYVNAMDGVPSNISELSQKISDRHFGIGSDGLVLIMPSETADFRMRMFNSDGSEAEMCGNASRCVGKYVYEKGLTTKSEVRLETGAGIKILRLHIKSNPETGSNEVSEITVDMGCPELIASRVPALSVNERKVSELEIVNGKEYRITAVSMGNPHAVIFSEPLVDSVVLGEGPHLEVATIFPRKANIEFAEVIDRNHIRMRVWERGAGETLACGTGACATLVAAVLNGLTDRKAELQLLGGTLHIEWDEETDHVMMTGPAEFIADGTYYY